jgi:hypothetical protein
MGHFAITGIADLPVADGPASTHIRQNTVGISVRTLSPSFTYFIPSIPAHGFALGLNFAFS